MRAVLMLHGVDSTGSVVSVTAAQLRSLISAIRDAGHDLVTLDEAIAGRPRSVALTFDDGFRSLADEAAPLLAELGAPATLFLTTGYVGRDNQWPGQYAGAPRFEMMTWAQVRQLADMGWSIQAHSVTHPDLRRLDDEKLERELTQSKAEIADRIGAVPTQFAYPYGWFDRRVRDFVRKHFTASVTTKMATLDAGPSDPHQIPRLDAYYLRSMMVHRPFAGRRFSAYLGARTWLRRLRAHPGEIEVQNQ